MKENLNPLASDVKNKDDFWNSSETDCSLGDKDFTSGSKNDALDSVELCVMTKELFENETDVYTDKNVTECHLPELIVCYNDSTCNNVVRDICIDDGTHSEKKILIENVKDDLDGLKSKFSSHEYYDECGNVNKEGVDGLKSPTVEYSSGDDIDRKSSSESDSDHDPCGPADQLQMSEGTENAVDKSMEFTLRDEFCSNSKPLVVQLSPQTSLKSLLDSSDDAEEQSCQIRHEEAIPKDPVPIPATEESNKSGIANDSNTCKPPKTNTQDVGPEDVNGQPIKLPNKDVNLENISVGNQVQREEGETSFSVVVPNSGVIIYSGPITYSGSVSFRSDSSTTSTRSFAFPVLPNEWNSSPIRMAKAERGYFRRHRRWKQGLLCCKF